MLLGPRASLKPFAETVVLGEALHDTLRALASLAGILRAQLTADTQAPWADLDRIGRVCSAADRDEAFVELAWPLPGERLGATRHGIDLSDSVTPGGDLSVLHLGGFATYTTLSTALGFVAAALPALSGDALASSLLGAMLGPAGRPVLGDASAGRAIGPNARRMLRLVATVAMIRQGAAASAPQGVPRRTREPAPA
ncbi:MAG: hypothetical protein NTW15_13370 [Burkholderiales bacterium]|nr:hypothetical protein [Burkholderiales bacterium]